MKGIALRVLVSMPQQGLLQGFKRGDVDVLAAGFRYARLSWLFAALPGNSVEDIPRCLRAIEQRFRQLDPEVALGIHEEFGPGEAVQAQVAFEVAIQADAGGFRPERVIRGKGPGDHLENIVLRTVVLSWLVHGALQLLVRKEELVFGQVRRATYCCRAFDWSRAIQFANIRLIRVWSRIIGMRGQVACSPMRIYVARSCSSGLDNTLR